MRRQHDYTLEARARPSGVRPARTCSHRCSAAYLFAFSARAEAARAAQTVVLSERHIRRLVASVPCLFCIFSFLQPNHFDTYTVRLLPLLETLTVHFLQASVDLRISHEQHDDRFVLSDIHIHRQAQTSTLTLITVFLRLYSKQYNRHHASLRDRSRRYGFDRHRQPCPLWPAQDPSTRKSPLRYSSPVPTVCSRLPLRRWTLQHARPLTRRRSSRSAA